VGKGSELVNRSGATLLGIVGSVKRVTDIVGEIAAAASEQSLGVDQVNAAITQLDHVIQSNSAQTEELSATAHSFAEEAARLARLVGKFELGAHHEQAGHASPRALPPNSHPSSATQRRPAKAVIRAVAGKPLRTAGQGLAVSPVLAGSSAARSHEESFEEF
jgi:methyl-accepting chemotaxis protein